jgi:hypothetical protein
VVLVVSHCMFVRQNDTLHIKLFVDQRVALPSFTMKRVKEENLLWAGQNFWLSLSWACNKSFSTPTPIFAMLLVRVDTQALKLNTKWSKTSIYRHIIIYVIPKNSKLFQSLALWLSRYWTQDRAQNEQNHTHSNERRDLYYNKLNGNTHMSKNTCTM